MNAYGAATWGQFFIYQGFNEQAGWMHTSSGVDVVDEFAETVVTERGGALSYRYGKDCGRSRRKAVTLSYRAADGTLARRSFTTYRTHHGPIVARGEWQLDRLRDDGQARSRRCSSPSCGPRRSDYAGFLEVAQLQANSSNNTIFADADRHTSPICIRSSCRSATTASTIASPVDGSDPATDWRGLHRLDEPAPASCDPPNGWVQNTNNWP